MVSADALFISISHTAYYVHLLASTIRVLIKLVYLVIAIVAVVLAAGHAVDVLELLQRVLGEVTW